MAALFIVREMDGWFTQCASAMFEALTGYTP
ncbi:MAG: hypothetical protein RLZZ282_117 [Verrucomicrobiota bacterium]|jgi:hypothetical protein